MRQVFVGDYDITISQKLEQLKLNQSRKEKDIDKVLKRHSEMERAKHLKIHRREFALGQIGLLRQLGYRTPQIVKYMEKPNIGSFYRFINYCKKLGTKSYDEAYIFIVVRKTFGFLRNGTIYKLTNSKDPDQFKLTTEFGETILVLKSALYKRFDIVSISGTKYDC